MNDVEDLADLVARVTAVMVTDAPGAMRPRLHSPVVQVPCEGVTEISLVRYELSETLTTFTSDASTDDLLVIVSVEVIFWPSATVVGRAVLVMARSTCSLGGMGGVGGSGGCGVGGVGGSGGGGGGVGGGSGVGGSGGSGVGGVVIRLLVNVQTTKSPFAIAPSTFVPVVETSVVPFRVQSIVDS